MASLLKRTAILSFSRFTNQAVVLLSPILLVRILSVSEYGGYREFLLYAGIIAPFVSFAVARSLPYLIPKYPQQEGVWVTQTVLFVLASSSVAMIVIYLAADFIRAKTSFDFVTALQLYIFFFINLDFIELYWLAKKRTDYVLYYSSGRLLARMVVVVTAAFLTKDARAVVYSLVVLEAVRCLLVLWYAAYNGWFSRGYDRKSAALQMSYFLPLGSGAVIEGLSMNAAGLFVSAMIGAEALAFYVVGAFAVKIVDVLRGAIADVIFPDMVEVRSATLTDALPLWRRATVWYAILLFPVAVVFSYYADAIVTTLFTADFGPAIPVFSAYAFQLFLLSFDFHLPLRVQNANRYFLIGTVIALITKIALLYPAYLMFGLVGPVIAAIVSRLINTSYLANRMSHVYEASILDVVPWREIGKVLVAAAVCTPILVAGKLALDQLLLRSILFGAAYLAAYLWMLRFLGIVDSWAMVRNVSGAIRRRYQLSR